MISVIIPTFNRAATILRAAQSILDQTYKDIELIIVDDASSDNTNEKIGLLKDERLKYIRLSKNAGA